MTWLVDQIWRHPIKGIGTERLDAIDLQKDRPLPLDRAWAVLETGGDMSDGWRSCRNFLRGAKGPSLMAVRAKVDGKRIVLSHPDRPDISIDPDAPASAAHLFDWLAPIYPQTLPQASMIVKAPEAGLSDAPFASVSILSCASLRALSQKLGQPLDPRRFRGNLWLEGLAPWEEFDLIGQHVRIGTAILEVIEPIGRCRATEANPDTGRRDANTLRALEDGWDHKNFGVYAMVRTDGYVAQSDTVERA